MSGTVKVLIIDDSYVLRKCLENVLASDAAIEIVGSAPDVFVGREIISRIKPDVIILDIEMPRMNGLEFLEKLMKSYPIPVIIFSTKATLGSEVSQKAFELGALDAIEKPKDAASMEAMSSYLINRLKTYRVHRKETSNSQKSNTKKPNHKSSPIKKKTSKSKNLIVIGASTGGTEAILKVLQDLPVTCPGILIVQHMPEKFTKSFSMRLNDLCNIEVREAQDGEYIYDGLALVAPGNQHLTVLGKNGHYRAYLKDGPLVSRHRPSVDVLFRSAAKASGKDTIAIILTGMGKDGAEGMKDIKDTGALTIAQDEATCSVFGMPKEAIANDAIRHVLPIDKIVDFITKRAAIV